MLAVFLALAASASWGVADFGGGLMSRRLPAVTILLIQQATALVVVGVVIAASGTDIPSSRYIWLSLAAGAFGALALGTFYRALAVGTMSIVAPISACGAVVPVVVGIASGDRFGAIVGIGLAVTFAGVLLAAREGGEEHGESFRLSVILAVVAAGGFGTYFTLSDAAADASVLWLLFLGRCSAIPLILSVGTASKSLRRPGRRDLGIIASIGIVDLVATGLYALAMTKGLLSVVAVVGSLYPITTVLLARFVLGERLRPDQAAGVALAFAGVGAVAAG